MKSALPIIIVALLAAVIVPIGFEGYGLFLATEILVWMLFAISFGLVLGYAGMLSIAHSLFFGLGAYTVILLSQSFGINLVLLLLAAILVTAIVGFIVGAISVRVMSHSFIVVTLIFSQVGFLVALSWRSLTGGDDGINLEAINTNLLGWHLDLANPNVAFLFCLLVVTASYFLLRRIVNSPLGDAFVAIRENPNRAALLGYNVILIRLAAFTISAIFAGLAGALYASVFHYANADLFKWVVSGDAIIWTVIGGMGTLIGPALGTAVLIVVRDQVGLISPELYLVFVGILIIIAAIYTPKGIMGGLVTLKEHWSGRLRNKI